MFSIYGTAGRLFNGPLEELRDLRRVPAQQPVERIGPIGDHELDFLQTLSGMGEFEAEPAAAAEVARPQQRADALGAYASTGAGARHRIITVAELMSAPALTVPAQTPADAVWQLLDSTHFAQAPVLDAQERLVGLLRRIDLAPAPTRRDAGALDAHWLQPASALMRSPVPAVAIDADVRRVALLLVQARLPGLPVVDDGGAVLGYIGRGDLLRGMAHDPPLDLWA